MAGQDVLYQHADGAMLRAAARPLGSTPATWPVLDDPGSCRSWLRESWDLPGFADAVRHASGSFAATVEAVINGQVTDGRQIRRVTLSAIRYLLRSLGRPTPFGLFAGVAPVRVSDHAEVSWGTRHRMLVRADTLWLDDVIERQEAFPDLLPGLHIVACDLVVDRGDRIELPRGPGRVTVRNTAVVRLIRDVAARPVRALALAARIADSFPGVGSPVITGTIHELVRQGVLITSLRAPMTAGDPLGHVIDVLGAVPAGASSGQADSVAGELRGIQENIRAYNAVTGHLAGQVTARLRASLTERMRRLSPAGRAALAGDLHLDCHVTVPAELATQMAHAVTALVRLTRQPRPDPAWNDWCREFWERYGTGAVVPVKDAVHPDSGLGWPAGFPASMLTEPEPVLSSRDDALLRLAWDAVTDRQDEIVLTDDVIAAITAETPVDPRRVLPHAELAARVHAASKQALQAGDYSFTVRPAWAFGTLTSRFGPAVTSSGLDPVFAATPAGVDGALSVQLSFPPLFPHAENVARLPAHLPHVLALGEHRRAADPPVIGLDDLGIVAVADGLHLVSISRRQVIEPQVFHALALKKQAPPLARFLATMTRGFLARYTEFDWGPSAARLPFLPRVRYRKAILSPATWNLTSADAAIFAKAGTREAAVARWRERRNCPDAVELHDGHRSLRLDLTCGAHLELLREHLDVHGTARLTETETVRDTMWMSGHVHEIVMPFNRAGGPAPNLVTGSLPLITSRTPVHRPAEPGTSWLYAQVFTHPERIDDLIRAHLPGLLTLLDGEPAYWFARYRSVRETDQLRLRIRTTSPGQYAAAVMAVGRWGEQLRTAGAASRIALATYHPEIGRYGSGAAMDAAENVFAADSHAVAVAFRLLPPAAIDPIALTAIGMAAIAEGFHATLGEANRWLQRHLARKAGTPAARPAAAQAGRWATHRTLPDGSALPAELDAAWRSREDQLARYRRALPDDCDTDRVLLALLHMHHNRARLIDRDDEATCLRLARQIALTWHARAPQTPA
jgi:thiopeptide-type bacteriocin biosynthesis protein